MIFVGNEIVARSWYHLQVLSLLNEFLIVIHFIVFYRFFNFMLHVESLNCTQQAIKDLNPLLFTIKLRIPISSSTSDKYPENGKLSTS